MAFFAVRLAVTADVRFTAFGRDRFDYSLPPARQLRSVALTLDLKGGRCERARIALFGAEDTPRVMNSDVLLDRPLDPRLIGEAARSIAASANPRADYHACAEYRRELIEVLTRRALQQASAT